MNKVVVLSSGGMDSTVCLARAVAEVGNENVISLSITYGQKHIKELEAARKVAEYYKVKHYEKDLTSVFNFSECSLLSKNNEEIPHESYEEQLKEKDGIVATYVPFRNGLFLSCAAAIALSLGADTVCYGAHADDAAGNAYPDCSVSFVNSMDFAIFEGTGYQIHLWAPLIHLNKTQVLQMGCDYNAPLGMTWSCYEGGDEPCGKCGTCIDRARAFANLGLEDPAISKK